MQAFNTQTNSCPITVVLAPEDLVLCSSKNNGCAGGSLKQAWE